MGKKLLLLIVLPLVGGCADSVREYQNEEGRFRVRMPGEPVVPEDESLPKGVSSVRLLQRSGSYTVAWEDLQKGAEASDDERLDSACDQAVQAIRGKEVSRTPIHLHGKHQGRELILRTRDGKRVLHDRMYLVEGRLYQVVAEGEQWWIESDAVRKYLDSFALLE